MVEFALVLPVLLFLLLGMIDFGKAFNYWIDETHLANEGARWAVVNKNPGTPDSLTKYLKKQLNTRELAQGGNSIDGTGAQVCIHLLTDGSAGAVPGDVGQPVQVTINATFRWMPFFNVRRSLHSWPIGPITTNLRATAVMRLEAKATNYTDGECYSAPIT